MKRCKYCKSKRKNPENYREIEMCIECVYEYAAIMDGFRSNKAKNIFTIERVERAPLPPEVKKSLKSYDKLLFGEENVE